LESDSVCLASLYADTAAEIWEDRTQLSFCSLPSRIIDAARRALIPRSEAKIERRNELVRAEYQWRQRAGLIDVNGAGSMPGYYDLVCCPCNNLV
jgi:hypothetical protein